MGALLTKGNQTLATPTQAQRDFSRIIDQIGTPAQPPKARGKSAGREKVTVLNKRERQPVVKKNKKAPKRPKSWPPPPKSPYT